MKGFVFSLQKILDIKSARESHIEQCLAAAIVDADATRDRINELQSELRELLARLDALRGSAGRSDRLRSHLQYVDSVHEGIDERSGILLSQERRIDTLRNRLIDAIRERKTLERLREHERQEWATANRRAEQKLTDEAATSLFARRYEEEAAQSSEHGGYGG